MTLNVLKVAVVVLLLIGDANPASAAVTPERLHAALLTVEDLPPGYESADEWNDIVRPGEPDPDICDNPVAVGSVVNRPHITAHTSFFRTRGGPLLYEILVAAGPAKARALVADVATAPKRCPVVRLGNDKATGKTDTAKGKNGTATAKTDTAKGRNDTATGRPHTAKGQNDTANGTDDLSLTVTGTPAPDVGEHASAVLIETETEPPIRTRLIVFAEGDVTAVIMTVGAEDAGLRAMHTIARTAAGKLARAN